MANYNEPSDLYRKRVIPAISTWSPSLMDPSITSTARLAWPRDGAKSSSSYTKNVLSATAGTIPDTTSVPSVASVVDANVDNARIREAMVIRARYLEAGYEEDSSSSIILGVYRNVYDQNGIRYIIKVKILVGGGSVSTVTTTHMHGDFGELVPSIMMGPSIQANEETFDQIWFTLRADYILRTS